jgi:hypothetical protein
MCTGTLCTDSQTIRAWVAGRQCSFMRGGGARDVAGEHVGAAV